MSDEDTSDRTGFGFRQVPEGEKAPLVRAVFDSVAPRYDLMNDLMSAGIHRWWKAEMVALAQATAGAAPARCRRRHRRHRLGRTAAPRPAARVAGAAPSSAMSARRCSAIGRARALDQGILTGIEWLCADAERLPIADRSVDLYTIGFGLRNVTRIDAALAEARRVLKPGGHFLCLEFTPEITPLLQPLYDLYSFQVVPLLGQIVTGDRDAYTYLVESIRGFPRQSELARDDRPRRVRPGQVPQPDGGRRCAPFGLAPLTAPDRRFGLARSLRNFARLIRICLTLARHDALAPLRAIPAAAPFVRFSRLLARRSHPIGPARASGSPRRSKSWGRASSSSGSCCPPAPICSAKRSRSIWRACRTACRPSPAARRGA